MFRAIQIVVWLMLAGMATVTHAADMVIYPSPEEARRYEVYIKVLQAALEATREEYGDYTLRPAVQTMSESRQMQELGKNTGAITVSWSGTTFIDMGSLHVIPIPLLKGLLSYRLLVVRKETLAEFENLDLPALRKKITAHAHGWGDSFVFEEHGLQGHTTSYRGLYSLLKVGRIDYLNRGVTEAYYELEARRRDERFAVVPGVMLFYPWPYYFYVNRGNRRLEDRLAMGLRKIIASGEHEHIVNQHAKTSLVAAQLSKRSVIHLSNPWLEHDWQDDCKGCWYVPEGMTLDALQR